MSKVELFNHVPLMEKITPWQMANLWVTALFLRNVPPDRFNMLDITQDDDLENSPNPDDRIAYRNERRNRAHECRTAGCVLGWGPAAGVEPVNDEQWIPYGRRVFGIETQALGTCNSPLWNWVFDGSWTSINNTPEGAMNRIVYAIVHGIPLGKVLDLAIASIPNGLRDSHFYGWPIKHQQAAKRLRTWQATAEEWAEAQKIVSHAYPAWEGLRQAVEVYPLWAGEQSSLSSQEQSCPK